MHGPRIDRVIFWVALPLIAGVSVPLVLFPVEGEALLSAAFGWLTRVLGWAYLWFTIAAFALLVYYALGKYGNVRFGGPDAKPEFSLVSWIAMIFCAGIGASVLYWGTIEWVYYYTNPPFGLEPRSREATEWAATYGLFHWGFTAWAIYCIPTLPLAYLFWNRGRPILRMSAACEGVIGERAARSLPGKFIDMMFMFGLLGGVGTSIGLSTPMISAGLSELLGVARGFWLDAAVVITLGVIFGVSVYTGLQRGIRMLSRFNLWLTIALLAFVFLAGPTLFIIDTFTNSVGLLVQNFIKMSFYLDPVAKAESMILAAGESGPASAGTFSEQWTIFYWAWWLSWAPFVGLFIARVSRGRTVRQLVGCMLAVPVLLAALWMNAFGATALSMYIDGGLSGVVEAVEAGRLELALFSLLEVLPFGGVTSGIAIVLVAVFFITSSDSGSLVIDTITAGGKLDAPVALRVFWCTFEGLVAITLLVSGGLVALQTAALVTGLPFALVLLAMCLSTWKGLRAAVREGGAG